MSKNKEAGKLKRIIKNLEKEERKEKSPAESILKKIKEREAEDEVKRAEAAKFIEEYVKENGKIKYFPDQWRATKVWRDAYQEGYEQAQWEGEEEHKELIYALVKKLC